MLNPHSMKSLDKIVSAKQKQRSFILPRTNVQILPLSLMSPYLSTYCHPIQLQKVIPWKQLDLPEIHTLSSLTLNKQPAAGYHRLTLKRGLAVDLSLINR